MSRSVLQPCRIAFVAVTLLFFIFWQSRGQPATTLSTQAFHRHDDDSEAPSSRLRGHDSTATAGAKPGFRPVNDSKIAMVTFTTEQKSFTHLSLKNKAHYAKKQGYDFLVDFEQDNARGLMWHKFEMVQRVINASQHDWIWWMDFDTLITNTDIRLQDIIAEALANATQPDSVDWIFTPDCFQLNAGSFITRATPRAHEYINAVIAYHTANATSDHQLSEQDCMRDVMFQSTRFRDNYKFIAQHKINAFPDEIKCYDETKIKWEPGSFAIHFAGAWAHMPDRDDAAGYLMKKYESFIQW